MTLIELLVFLFWVVGGAWAGHNVAQLLAPAQIGSFTVGGGLLALFMLFFGMPWFFSKFDHQPNCRCGGKQYEDFEIKEDPDWGYVHKCKKCGARYLMRKGFLWFEILQDNSAGLFLKQDFLCKWKQATEEEIANKRFQRTVAPRRANVR